MLIALVILGAGLASDADWTHYGHDAGGTRHSSLKQVNAGNVGRLKVAWTYHTGALEPRSSANERAAFEATPILVDGTLYLTTPFNHVIALDPATGKERWRFDPHVNREADYSEVTSRGVAWWSDGRALRIFEGTIDARLIALDGKTGKLCDDFGDHGQVDLTRGVEILSRPDYQVTSAPIVVGNLVITGSSIGDNRAVNVERGMVRAYDVRTGKLRWTWDPIPWSASQKVRTGAANAWSTFSADAARDLVFIPTGSASPDFYGGERPGYNAHANSVVAFEGVHRRPGMGLSSGASRPLGLRRGLAAGADHVSRQGCSSGDNEDRQRVCAGPRNRQAVDEGRGTRRPQERCGGRDSVGYAAHAGVVGDGSAETDCR